MPLVTRAHGAASRGSGVWGIEGARPSFGAGNSDGLGDTLLGDS